MEVSAEDIHWMQKAYLLAQKAQEEGEVPVGAVIVSAGEIIGEGWNQPISSHDPSAHAEMIAIRKAAQAQNNYRLHDATLYVTLEPCPMCAGAMVHARIRRVVFAAPDPRTGAAGSVFNLLKNEQLNHKAEIVAGVMEMECSELIRNFFRKRR
jgi:tRNA(adenine34) deaminase